MINPAEWRGPLELSRVRHELESDPSYIDQFPGNLCVIGIISGYRIMSQTLDFREIQFDVTQGYNDEIRFHYVGEFSF